MDYVMVDLDGTLADTRHRAGLIDKGREGGPDWEAYSLACHLDTPVRSMVTLVQMLHRAGTYVQIASGRSIIALEPTKTWLKGNAVPYDDLLMRPEGDRTNNVDLKVSWIEAMVGSGWICGLVIDDYPAVLAKIEVKFGIPGLLVFSDGAMVDLKREGSSSHISAFDDAQKGN